MSKGSDSGGQMVSIFHHLSFVVSLHVKIIPKKNLKDVVYMSNATMDMPCPLFVDESHVSGIRIPCTLISHPDSSWLHVVTALRNECSSASCRVKALDTPQHPVAHASLAPTLCQGKKGRSQVHVHTFLLQGFPVAGRGREVEITVNSRF